MHLATQEVQYSRSPKSEMNNYIICFSEAAKSSDHLIKTATIGFFLNGFATLNRHQIQCYLIIFTSVCFFLMSAA